MNAVAIIPARGGSKRLPQKNIAPVLGKPVLAWSIQAAQASHYLEPGDIFVSTEDANIAEVALAYGAGVVPRPPELAADNVWTEPVIEHAVGWLEAQGRQIDLVVWMNACAPEILPRDVDTVVERVLNEGLREVFTVDENLKSTSFVRALRRETLRQHRLSVNCGVIILPYIDIHYAEDIARVEERLKARMANHTFRQD